MSTHDKIFVTSVFSLLPPMPTSTSTSIQGIVFYFLTFSYAFYADVDAIQGFLQYFMHTTNADVDVDVEVDLGYNLFTF